MREKRPGKESLIGATSTPVGERGAATADRMLGAASRSHFERLVAALRGYGALLGFALIVAFFSLLRPSVFLSPVNLRNILEQVAILAIVSATMTMVMAVGDFDLSVGALASLTGVVVASLLLDGWGTGPAVATGLVLGACAGALNGLLVTYFGLSAFVATLATMTAFRGLALWFTDGSTLFNLPSLFLVLGQGNIGSLPVPVLLAAFVAQASWIVLTQTTVGRYWYAVGANPQAAFLAGISVRRLRLLAFVASGLGAALAGIVLTSRLASAHPLAGEPFMLTSIAAVFLGMTMFREGQPNLPGTMVGVLVLGVLSNGLNILRVNTYLQEVLTGVIIVVAVLASMLTRRVRA
ncbi:ABC transporter permease [Thermomicrobiaceae bacterium CFH 74404]|uniref:ABC transporter permease n=1 Tax=Thermalbibacter longus TaxID=2951981 RepID=A0AA42B9S0_9BACT|nr:ABC transporter permease [Thermalbibacter longus]MCM8747600.1 ABC transporter permease [Thermalbibacter longus]